MCTRRCGNGNGVYEVFLDLVFVYSGENSLSSVAEITIGTITDARYSPSYDNSTTVFVGSSGSQGIGYLHKESRTISIIPYAKEINKYETIHLIFNFQSNVV